MEPMGAKLAVIAGIVCCVHFTETLVRGGEAVTDAAPADDWNAFRKIVLPFFAAHCFECHGEKQRGEVRLDSLRDPATLTKSMATLDKVRRVLGATRCRLKSGRSLAPPKSHPCSPGWINSAHAPSA